ncbi:MAG: hypothetical protein E6265_25945 [Enterobacteriaceae bacterium]|nr:hypothetical protein [Enterobacteriaceae bacterium]
MKQVTMESIRQRIADLELADNTFGLGLNTEFELACLRELAAVTEQRDALVVEMKSAFEKPQAYLTWHAIPPTWEDPLPCGEYLDVHDTDGHKNSDGTDCWPVYAKPETPATDVAIAALRAEGVEMFASDIGLVYQQLRKGSLPAKALKDVVMRATSFARQLRESKGANHE